MVRGRGGGEGEERRERSQLCATPASATPRRAHACSSPHQYGFCCKRAGMGGGFGGGGSATDGARLVALTNSCAVHAIPAPVPGPAPALAPATASSAAAARSPASC